MLKMNIINLMKMFKFSNKMLINKNKKWLKIAATTINCNKITINNWNIKWK